MSEKKVYKSGLRQVALSSKRTQEALDRILKTDQKLVVAAFQSSI